jgi:hypothetical protein
MKGLTLIEFVKTLIVFSIIAIVVILGVRKRPDINLDMATKKVHFDLSYIREKAISTNKRYKIYLQTPDTFMVGFGNYTLIINPENQSKFRYNLSNNFPQVTFFKNYSIVFDGIGRNVFKTQTSIILKSGNNQKIIKINPEHGRVYVLQ